MKTNKLRMSRRAALVALEVAQSRLSPEVTKDHDKHGYLFMSPDMAAVEAACPRVTHVSRPMLFNFFYHLMPFVMSYTQQERFMQLCNAHEFIKSLNTSEWNTYVDKFLSSK